MTEALSVVQCAGLAVLVKLMVHGSGRGTGVALRLGARPPEAAR